jgi:hypothetical protein
MDKLLPSVPKKIKLPIICFGISTCLPLIMAIDRGNFVVISVCLGILGFIELHENSQFKAQIPGILLLTFSISIKLYMLIFLLFLFVKGLKKAAFNTGVVVVVSNLIFSLFYPAGPIRIIEIYIKSILFYSGNADSSFPLNGNALVASVARNLDYWFNIDQFQVISEIGRYSVIAGALWLAISLFLQKSKLISTGLKFVIMLSCIQFFPPVSMYYTNIWALFALAILLNEIYIDGNLKFSQMKRVNFVTAMVLIVSILPIPIGWYLFFSGIAWMVILSFLFLRELSPKQLSLRMK